MSFFDFMLKNYEDSKDNKEDESVIGPINAETATIPRGPRRPPSTRIPYQNEAGKRKRCCIKRLQEHETLPRIIGKWFCQSDYDHERELFGASMLLLLKPWRDIRNLKSYTETIEDIFIEFFSQETTKRKLLSPM